MIRAYIELTKPRITWLILMSTGIGYWFGHQGPWNLLLLFHTILGTALIASGTAALNQWYERRADARMHRTRRRPLPSGRLSSGQALGFGLLLSTVGLAELAGAVNLLTGGLGLFTELTYLLLYTPLKQRSAICTTIGAIPGAMPPLIGYAAASGTLTPEGWVLYAILFVWQFPHFYSIAWMYREDYGRAGIRMLPVVEPDGVSTARRILWFLVALLPLSALPTLLDMTGRWYLAGALLLSAWFLYTGFRVLRERTVSRARGVLLASVVYLPALYGLMLFDRPGL